MVELVLIEVQTGHYLGEDDIVRFEDQYGRSTSLATTKAPIANPLRVANASSQA
jgi:hypothetical protein